MKKLAIVSVYDKRDLDGFARKLSELGVEILSTGGTARFLKEKGIPVRSVSDYTGSPEILEGRVKSLHPKIHGGILARRDRQDDMQQLEEHRITPVDFVVVNLYPFTHKVREIEQAGDAAHGSLVEEIDIGGPTMIRAAAKNARFVVPVCDPSDYPCILDQLSSHGEISQEFRQRLAAKVFTMMAAYDGAIARYFSLKEKLFDAEGDPVTLAPVESFTFEQTSDFESKGLDSKHAAYYRKFEIGKYVSRESSLAEGSDQTKEPEAHVLSAIETLQAYSEKMGEDGAAIFVKDKEESGKTIRLFFGNTTR